MPLHIGLDNSCKFQGLNNEVYLYGNRQLQQSDDSFSYHLYAPVILGQNVLSVYDVT